MRVINDKRGPEPLAFQLADHRGDGGGEAGAEAGDAGDAASGGMGGMGGIDLLSQVQSLWEGTPARGERWAGVFLCHYYTYARQCRGPTDGHMGPAVPIKIGRGPVSK
jgi:hypothetical protein